MRAYEFIEEDVSRRDFLRWMGAGSMAAAGAGAMTGDAEAAEWMSQKTLVMIVGSVKVKNLLLDANPS